MLQTITTQTKYHTSSKPLIVKYQQHPYTRVILYNPEQPDTKQ
jgi:hypothetical protein